MSHFVRIRTQIRETEMLTRSLRDLHYEYRQGTRLEVRGWQGQHEQAEIVVNTGSNYDIGFRRENEAYEVVADWSGVQGNTPIRQDAFIQQINQQYAYNVILDQAERDFLLIENVEELETGERLVHLVENYRL